MTAVAISALVLVAAMVALSFWAVRGARASSGELAAERVTSAALRQRVDELDRHVQDRDRANQTLTDELARERAARAAVATQRDEAIALVHNLAQRNPGAIAAAVRDGLRRLQELARADVPAAPASAPADAG